MITRAGHITGPDQLYSYSSFERALNAWILSNPAWVMALGVLLGGAAAVIAPLVKWHDVAGQDVSTTFDRRGPTHR